MRIKHRVHLPRKPKPAEISPEYQAQIDRSTDKLDRRYAEAQKRAERAQHRLEVARTRRRHHDELIHLERELAMRAAELFELECLMTSSPAGATHRGREGWTKVPR